MSFVAISTSAAVSPSGNASSITLSWGSRQVKHIQINMDANGLKAITERVQCRGNNAFGISPQLFRKDKLIAAVFESSRFHLEIAPPAEYNNHSPEQLNLSLVLIKVSASLGSDPDAFKRGNLHVASVFCSVAILPLYLADTGLSKIISDRLQRCVCSEFGNRHCRVITISLRHELAGYQ